MTTSSGKHLEVISHAQIFSLLYKLITGAQDTDDLSIGFDHDRERKQEQLALNKNINGKYHVRIILKIIFGFAQHKEKAAFVFGCNFKLTGNTENSVLNKDNATNIGKIKSNSFEWYVPPYVPSISQQAVLSKPILSKLPRELQFVERSVFMEDINTQNRKTY